MTEVYEYVAPGSPDVVLALDGALFKAHRAHLPPLPSAAPRVELAGGGVARPADVAALLQHIYTPRPLHAFADTARVLRGATLIGADGARAAAVAHLCELYPARGACAAWRDVAEAAELALDCRVREVLPALVYALVTTCELDIEDPGLVSAAAGELDVADPKLTLLALDPAAAPGPLTPRTTRLCTRLLHRLTDYFAPVLCTVATAGHMACTSALAEHWMAHALGPALEAGGLHAPRETLARIAAVDWAALGVCAECCAEKRAEWAAEAETVWGLVERWVEEDCGF